jgi:hypothetical protein
MINLKALGGSSMRMGKCMKENGRMENTTVLDCIHGLITLNTQAVF